MSLQPVVNPFGTVILDLPAGSRIALFTQASGSQPAILSVALGGSNNFTSPVAISNDQLVYGPFADTRKLKLEARADTIYYSVFNLTQTYPYGLILQRNIINAHKYLEDFDYYSASNWIISDGAVAGAATVSLASGDNGLLNVVTGATLNNGGFLQKTGPSYRFELGKELWLNCRIRVDSVLNSNLVFGLQEIDTTPLDTSNGVFFFKPSNTGVVTLFVEKSNLNTQTAVGTMADNTFFVFGFYYNGIDRIDSYFNNGFVASSPTTNLPDTTDLTISFGVQNSTAVARTMAVDFIQIEKAR